MPRGPKFSHVLRPAHMGKYTMIVDWVYSHPTWMWGSILVCGAVVLACLGLAIFHPLVDVRVRRTHNDLAGFSIAIISLVYTVLLAFIAVATWEAFASADALVQEEAGYIGNLHRDTRGFPDSAGQPMRKALEDYAETVIHQEWPVQQQGRLPSAGWKALYDLQSALVGYQPETRGQAVVEAEFLRTLNELYRAREARLTAAGSHIPPVIWWIILFGGLLTVGFTYLFGFESFGLHLTMTGAVAAALALIVVLIIALDWPFRGEISVTPEAYEIVVHGWNTTP
jgi:hypothetical protein